ncbi:hypothetical protein GEMRC1_013511 [Eukaryota sp. GEM-RC1]
MSSINHVDVLADVCETFTSILRTLSIDSKSASEEFLTYHVYDCLAVLTLVFSLNRPIIYNVARIISKLSVSDAAQLDISSSHHFLTSISRLFNIYKSDNAVLIRLAFALGNVCASFDEPRITFALSCDGIPSVLGILINRAQSFMSAEVADGDESDLIVKLIRLIANTSINPEVGVLTACREEIQVLSWLICTDLPLRSELLHNSVACVTNLSYYSTERNVLLTKHGIDLTEKLIDLCCNQEGPRDLILECLRALGNLSRDKEVRKLLTTVTFAKKRSGVAILATFLNTADEDIVIASCGVLMNIAADVEHRTCLKVNGVIPQLVEVAQNMNEFVSSSALKTLFNHALHNQDPFSDSEAALLKGVCRGLIVSSDDSDLLDVTSRMVDFLSLKS